MFLFLFIFFFFKQKTAYEMRISDWSSDVCSSDLLWQAVRARAAVRTMADVRNNTGERSVDEAAVRHAFLAIIDCIIGSGFTRDTRSQKEMTDDCHGNCIATPEKLHADPSAARILRRGGSREPQGGT